MPVVRAGDDDDDDGRRGRDASAISWAKKKIAGGRNGGIEGVSREKREDGVEGGSEKEGWGF